MKARMGLWNESPDGGLWSAAVGRVRGCASVSAVQVRPLLERLVEQDKAFGVLVKPSKTSAAQKLQCVAAGL